MMINEQAVKELSEQTSIEAEYLDAAMRAIDVKRQAVVRSEKGLIIDLARAIRNAIEEKHDLAWAMVMMVRHGWIMTFDDGEIKYRFHEGSFQHNIRNDSCHIIQWFIDPITPHFNWRRVYGG